MPARKGADLREILVLGAGRQYLGNPQARCHFVQAPEGVANDSGYGWLRRARSADPRQRIVLEFLEHALAADAGLEQHAGGLFLHSTDDRGVAARRQ